MLAVIGENILIPARYMLQRGSVPESRSIFQVAIKLCNNNGAEGVTPQLRLAHGNEARAAGESHDYTGCLHHANLWLDLLGRRVWPSRNPITNFELGNAYNEVGVAYALQNEFVQAQWNFLQAKRVHESVENLEATMLAEPKLNFGIIHWLQGDFLQAEAELDELLQIQENAFGVNDTQSLL